MSSRVLLWMAVSCALSVCAANEEAETCRPAARFATAPWWTSRLAQTRSRILKEKGVCYDLVLVGDSITHRWENPANGAAVYSDLQKRYKVLNLGNGGDRTQNVIWRFENWQIAVSSCSSISDLEIFPVTYNVRNLYSSP